MGLALATSLGRGAIQKATLPTELSLLHLCFWASRAQMQKTEFCWEVGLDSETKLLIPTPN